MKLTIKVERAMQSGKVVSSSEVDSVKQVKANVSELPQGYYLLSVQTNQGPITKPFVKN